MAGRVKNLQQQFRQRPQADKKPPDLLRAIGKIESSDWHVREIEKKILENKLGKPKSHEKERVPKWSREQVSYNPTNVYEGVASCLPPRVEYGM